MTIKTDNEKRIVFLTGALLGALVFLLIFGFQVLDFTYTDWLLPRDGGDLSQHYLGWVEYRASQWNFPIGLMDNVLYPEKVSVVYTDSIPILAFFFKLISGILPENFQYLGIFGFLCYALQGGFAAILVYHFTKQKGPSIIASLLFSCSLLLLWRMFEHTALSAHFLILAALYLWLCRENQITTRRSVVLWTLLSVLAMLIQGYFVAMVWGIMLCDILGQMLNRQFRRGVITIVVAGAASMLCGYLFGLFYGKMPVSGLYYGVYSFNLNGLINSQGYSTIFPALPLWDHFQYEGLAYLGAGALLLAVSLLVAAAIDLIRKHWNKETAQPESSENHRIRKMIPYIVFVVGFLAASVSNKISWGSDVLEIPLNDYVYLALAVFRCNGRLIWPVYYGIFLLLSVQMIRLFRNRPAVAGLVLLLALGLNLYDFSGLIKEKHDRFNRSERMHYQTPFTDPAWEEIAGKYDHLMYFPQVAVIYSNAIGYDFQLYALEHGLTLNCIYFARDISTKVDAQTLAYMDAMDQNTPKDTAFIFIHRLPEKDYGLHYYRLNDILVGTPLPLEGAEEIDFQNLDVS